jgi:sugar lactone lactonase YvrE
LTDLLLRLRLGAYRPEPEVNGARIGKKAPAGGPFLEDHITGERYRYMPSIDVFARQRDITGESPLWIAGERALYWLDIGRKLLHRQEAGATSGNSWSLPEYPGCIAELERGAIAVTVGTGLHRLDLESGELELLQAAPLKRSPLRFNDGKVDPKGRLWASTMQNNFGPRGEFIKLERWDGSLFRFNPDGPVDMIEDHLGCANTLAWSPDLARFYFADSMKNCIFVYDFDVDTGTIGNRRVFFDAKNLGVPDGSAMDVDGCLWNVRCNAGAIVRLTPDGRIDRTIALPVPRPTSCAFGGPDLDTLFVTSARRMLDDDALAKAPLSGSVFAIGGLTSGVPIPPLNWKPH